VKAARRSRAVEVLLAVTELPFGVTTTSLIDSILAANAKGRSK
jgi:topoisomerase-4 subunit A